MKRFLKNNGIPSRLTISTQRKVGYYDKNGIHREIHVLMHREHDDNKEAKAEALPLSRKKYFEYVNGKLRDKITEVDIGHSYIVDSYPHIMNFPVGTSKRDERTYNLKVGEVVEVPSDYAGDADILMKHHHCVDEVSQKGEIIQENPNRPKPAKEVDKNQLPRTFVEEPTDAPWIPRGTPRDKRITKIEEDKEMPAK